MSGLRVPSPLTNLGDPGAHTSAPWRGNHSSDARRADGALGQTTGSHFHHQHLSAFTQELVSLSPEFAPTLYSPLPVSWAWRAEKSLPIPHVRMPTLVLVPRALFFPGGKCAWLLRAKESRFHPDAMGSSGSEILSRVPDEIRGGFHVSRR